MNRYQINKEISKFKIWWLKTVIQYLTFDFSRKILSILKTPYYISIEFEEDNNPRRVITATIKEPEYLDMRMEITFRNLPSQGLLISRGDAGVTRIYKGDKLITHKDNLTLFENGLCLWRAK